MTAIGFVDRAILGLIRQADDDAAEDAARRAHQQFRDQTPADQATSYLGFTRGQQKISILQMDLGELQALKTALESV